MIKRTVLLLIFIPYLPLFGMDESDTLTFVNNHKQKNNGFLDSLENMDLQPRFDPKIKNAKKLINRNLENIKQSSDDESNTDENDHDIDKEDSLLLSGFRKLEKSAFGAALEDLNLLIKINPRLDMAYGLRALAKFNLGDNRGAEEDGTTAIKLSKPQSANYSLFLINRGLARHRLLNFSGARNDYDRALALNPGNFDAFLRRGHLSIVEKRYPEAIDDLDNAIRVSPKACIAYLLRGLAMRFTNGLEKAMADYNTSITLDSKNTEAYVRRGELKSVTKDYAGAVADFSKSLSLDSTLSFAYFCRARCFEEILVYEGAMKDYDKVIALDPDNDLTYFCRARLRAKNGDYVGAIEDYNQMALTNPQNVYAFYNRANMWFKLNYYKKAMDDYTTAISMYKNFSKAYYNRSIVRRSMNDRAGAIEDYKMASKLDSNFLAYKNDSAIFAKLTDFKANFEALSPEEQNNSWALYSPFKNIEMNVVRSNQTAKSTDGELRPSDDARIVQLNRGLKNWKFCLVIQDSLFSPANYEELRALHNEVDKGSDAAHLLASSIIKTKMQDYNMALSGYDSLLRTNSGLALGYFCRANARCEIASIIKNMNGFGKMEALTTRSGPTQKTESTNGEKDDLTNDFKHCIELEPAFSYTYYNFANYLTTKHDFNSAAVNLTKAIERNSKFGEAYFNRGLVYLCLREKEAGCMDLSKAGELGIKRAYSAIRNFCK